MQILKCDNCSTIKKGIPEHICIVYKNYKSFFTLYIVHLDSENQFSVGWGCCKNN